MLEGIVEKNCHKWHEYFQAVPDNANLFKKLLFTKRLEHGTRRSRGWIWAPHEDSCIVHTCDGNILGSCHYPLGMVWLDRSEIFRRSVEEPTGGS